MLTIGRSLRALRGAHKVTHRQLALAVGVTEGTISNLETNKAEPSADTMAKIADYFGVTMDELRDEAPQHAATRDLEARLIEAARRVQEGDQSARSEMRRIAAALGTAEEVASAARNAAPKTPAARKKGT